MALPKGRPKIALQTVNPRTKAGEATPDGRREVKVPKGKAGNTKGDAAFIDAEAAKGLIIAVDEDEEDVPFGVKKRWIGDPKDFQDFSYWVIPPEEFRCTAFARVRDEEGRHIADKDGKVLLRPCLRPSIRGGTVCVQHGGGVESVRKAAQMRLISAADGLIGELIRIAMDPKVDAKARVQAINSALDRAGIKGTVDVKVDIPKYKEMLGELFSGEWGGDE